MLLHYLGKLKQYSAPGHRARMRPLDCCGVIRPILISPNLRPPTQPRPKPSRLRGVGSDGAIEIECESNTSLDGWSSVSTRAEWTLWTN